MNAEVHALARRRMSRAREAFEEGECLRGRERPHQKRDYGDFATLRLDEACQVRDEIRAFLSRCAHMLDQLSPRDGEGPDV